MYLLLAEGLRTAGERAREAEHLDGFDGREQGGGGREAVLGGGVPGALEGGEREGEVVGYARAD